MITAQFLYSFAIISLVMTVFILEKSEKLAMTPKYLGIMMVLSIISIFGFFIWTPTLNMERYKQGIIDTETPIGWFLFVNILRMALFGYALFKYAMITKKTEDEAKQRMRWFFIGILISIIGLVFNLLGGILKNTLIEILALILFNIGTITIVKGFFI